MFLVFAINPVDYNFHFEITEKHIISPADLPLQLAELVFAMQTHFEAVNDKLPEDFRKLFIGLNPGETSLAMAKALSQPNSVVITGALFENHPDAALLRTLVYCLEQFGVRILRLSAGANSNGGALAGMLPHRAAAGKRVDSPGLSVQTALEAHLKGYFLLGVEPGYDFANPRQARRAMLGAEFVVMLSAFQNESMQDYCNVILPIAPYAETSGTYINVDHVWQSVRGVLKPYGESRPAWKVLRVLGNLLDCKDFNYLSSEEVLDEVKTLLVHSTQEDYVPYCPDSLPTNRDPIVRVGEWPLYRGDMIVRHAEPLQRSAAADLACLKVHPSTAKILKLQGTATVTQGDIEITLPLVQDERIAPDVVWVANGMLETIDLGNSFGAITIKA